MALNESEARERAEAEVRGYCGWHIAPSRREVLVLDGEDAPRALLPTLRLTAVHSVSVNGTPVDPDGVQWSASGIVVWSWTYPRLRVRSQLRGVEADVTHGWEEWPVDVLSVLDRLASRTMNDPGNLVQVGAVRVGTGPDGLPLGGSLTQVDRDVLDRYLIPGRP